MNAPSPTDTDRRTTILDAAVESFGKLGYYGTSLQRIATEVGLTKAGVLHYVGSKEGLLKLIADMWRQVVAVNNKRPALVHMFSTLSAEALDPTHPAHDYFADRERRTVTMALNINWAVPEGVNVEHVLQAGFSMMDGLQLRWLRAPGQDLNAMWADCEDVLMPLPLWDGYR